MYGKYLHALCFTAKMSLDSVTAINTEAFYK